MNGAHRWTALGAAAVFALGLGACPDDGGGSPADAVVDALGPSDAAEDAAADDVVDASGGEDAVDDAADATPPRPEPGTFRVGSAALSAEYVFKGVWAGEAGVIIAVGNDGVVASRDAEGRWSVLTRAEGAALLNAISGDDPSRLWAVGMNGTILPGTTTTFGESGACESASDCEDSDPCTLNLCSGAGACEVEPSGFAGCCGAPVGSWGFESGALSPWAVIDTVGGMTWQVSTARAATGTSSLYFGDPSQTPPSYDNGQRVAATAVSPPVTLPASGTATLRFELFLESEPDAGFDSLEVSVQSGANVAKVWEKASLAAIPTGGFVPVEVDLTAWRGLTISLRFRFDSVDGSLNFYEGAYIDDVVIDTACAAAGSANSQSGPTLWGVYAASADAAFAVGQGGAIQQWDGATWAPARGADQSLVWNGIGGHEDRLALVGNGGEALRASAVGLGVVETNTSAHLHAVDTVDGEVFWAVGDQGTIARGDDAGWVVQPGLTTVSLRDVFAVSNDEVWAVGYFGTVLRFDGDTWSWISFPETTDLLAIWIDDGGRVTVTGRDGQIWQREPGSNTFNDAGTFHAGGELVAAWGHGEDLVLVGTSGRIVTYRDGAWGVEAAGTSQGLLGVWGSGPDDIWAVGRAGTIVRWDGVSWERVTSPTTGAVNDVWGSAADRVYAAGTGGAVILWDGTAWTSLVSSTTQNLRAASGRSATEVWAVGANATIMRFNGFGWSQAPVEKTVYEDGTEEEVTDELHAVWAAAADDAWAVGANGRMLRWDGALWRQVETEFTVTLRGLYGLAADDIWAVGNAGHILHYNGEAWARIESGSVATLHAIHGDGAEHVVIVGGLGTVLTLER